MIIKRVLSSAALVAIAVAIGVAQAPDPLLGTWKLNAAKSKAPYASGTTVFEATGDTLKGTVNLVGTDGTKYHWTFAAKYDGKDHPATGSSPFGDTLAITRVNPNTVRIVSKLAGKPTNRANHRRGPRWQDTHHDREGHGRQGTASRQHVVLRETVEAVSHNLRHEVTVRAERVLGSLRMRNSAAFTLGRTLERRALVLLVLESMCYM